MWRINEFGGLTKTGHCRGGGVYRCILCCAYAG